MISVCILAPLLYNSNKFSAANAMGSVISQAFTDSNTFSDIFLSEWLPVQSQKT